MAAAVKRMAKRKKSGLFLIIFIVLSLFVIFGILVGKRFSEYAEKELYPVGYSEIVSRYSAEYGIPKTVIYAVIRTESGFDPDAVSNAGAAGLMQLMPASYEWACYRLGEETVENGRTDPEINIRCGSYLLSYFYQEFGDWDLVFAAYNAGDSRVKKWLSDPELSQNGKLNVIPFRETEHYVNKVKNAWEAYERLYGISRQTEGDSK